MSSYFLTIVICCMYLCIFDIYSNCLYETVDGKLLYNMHTFKQKYSYIVEYLLFKLIVFIGHILFTIPVSYFMYDLLNSGTDCLAATGKCKLGVGTG